MLGAAALAGLVLAACSSTNNAATTTTASGSSATTAPTSASTTAGGSSSSELNSLSSSVQAAEHATFKAVYTSQSSSGSQTITIEQKPPKSVFGSGTTSVINDGTTTYVCTPAGGSEQCVSESTGGANPLGSLANLFSPQALVTVFQQVGAQAAAHAAGYTLTFSDGTYAGQHAKCISATGGPQGSGKYCVTDAGILAFVQSPSGTFQLTSYSSSPSDSDFAIPSGATVVTVPSIPTSG